MKTIQTILLLILLLSFKLYSEDDFWEEVSPPIAEITDIEFDSFGNIYACTQYSLYVSSNFGETWTEIYDVKPYNYENDDYIRFDDLVISKDNKFAIISGKSGGGYGGGRHTILFSTDMGFTWKNIKIPNEAVSHYLMDLDFNNNTIYLLTYSGSSPYIYFYNEVESSWHEYGYINNIRTFSKLSVLNDSCLAIGIWGTIQKDDLYFTTNHGKNWVKVELFEDESSGVCSIKYFSDNEIFIGTNKGLYILKDYKEIELLTSDSLLIENIYMPNRKDIYLACRNFIYFSLDSGKTWNYSIKGLENLDKNSKNYFGPMRVNKVIADKNNNLYAQTYYWGVYKSTDIGENWFSCNSGFFSAPIFGIAFDKEKNVYIASYGLFKSTDKSKSWDMIGFEGERYVDIFYSKSGYLLACAYDKKTLFKSYDGGHSWRETKRGLIIFDKILENSKGTLFAKYSTGGFCRSYDEGDNWDYIYPPQGINNDIVLNNEDHIFVTGSNEIMRSKDDGNTWDIPYKHSNNGFWDIYEPAFFFKNLPIGYVLNSWTREVYKTTDNGETWNIFETYDEQNKIDLIGPKAIDSLNNFLWYAEDNHSNYLLAKTDAEGNYIDTIPVTNLRMQGGNVSVMEVSPDGYLWGYLPYNGVYRSKQRFVAVPEQTTSTSSSPLLNYPNPFTSTTEITYSIPEASFVHLSIYDILGIKVQELVSDWQEAGTHKIKFDGTNLPSGIYFIKLEAGGFVQRGWMNKVD